MKNLLLLLAIPMLLFSCKKDKTEPIASKIERDITYGPAERNKMDVWYPEGYSPSSRVVFIMHPGGFYEGDKSMFDFVAKYYQEHQFVVVNLNYRFIDTTGLRQDPPLHIHSATTMTDAVNDVDLAVHYVMDHAAAWKIGTRKMYMTGHSAGALLTLIYTQGAYNDDGKIKAGGNWAGQTDLSIPSDTILPSIPPFFKELLYRWSGYEPRESNNLALFAISGFWQAYGHTGHPMITCYPQYNGDQFISTSADGGYVNAQNFHQLLRSRGVTEKLVYYPNEGHGLDLLPGTWDDVLEQTRVFFEAN